MKRFAVLMATAGGAGYAPFAPGTAGSAVGLLIYFLMRTWPALWQVAVLASISGVGLWASGVAARHFNREDPGEVVIDEVAGQLATLCLTGAGAWGAYVTLVAVHPGGTAGLAPRSDHHRFARHR